MAPTYTPNTTPGLCTVTLVGGEQIAIAEEGAEVLARINTPAGAPDPTGDPMIVLTTTAGQRELRASTIVSIT